MSQTQTALFSRLWGRLFSFGTLHMTNTGLNLVYTLVQLLIFARLLPEQRYAEIVLLTAIGFYLQPLNQALGRANYVVLRHDRIDAGRTAPRDEVSALLLGETALLTLVCLLAPLAFSAPGTLDYVEDVLYLSTVLFMNAWAFSLQSTAWAVDLEFRFTLLSFTRRLFYFGGLLAFILTGKLIAFGLVAGLGVIAFHMAAIVMMERHTSLLPAVPRWRKLSAAAFAAHVRQCGISLLSAFCELTVLNSPYALLAIQYGAGPVAVTFDTVMKLARLAMAVTRTLAEIYLSRVTRLLIERKGHEALASATKVTALSIAASAVPAVLVLWQGPMVFSLLLGPNNVVPPQTSAVAAAIILVSGLYQPVLLFLSYAQNQRAIIWLTAGSLLAFGAFAATLFAIGPGDTASVAVVTAYSLFFTTCAVLGAVLTVRMFRRAT